MLDAMGVIYQAGDDVNDLLIPYVRGKGCRMSDAGIEEIYTYCSLGRFTSSEFWRQIGVLGDANDIEQEYLSLHKTSPGLHAFLQKLRQLKVRTLCLSNDVKEWSIKLRRMHNLEPYFSSWVISGEVGARKPDPKIYKVLQDELGDSLQGSLFIDDRVRNLLPVKQFGLVPVLFAGPLETASPDEWLIASSFKEVEGWILRSNT